MNPARFTLSMEDGEAIHLCHLVGHDVWMQRCRGSGLHICWGEDMA